MSYDWHASRNGKEIGGETFGESIENLRNIMSVSFSV